MKLRSIIQPLLLKNRITELTYFTTNSCNFFCKHCFMTKKLNVPMQELTHDEIAQMGKYIHAMQRVHLGGGEPMMKKDIAEKAVTIANEWNAEVICIPTNGWFKDTIVHTIQHFGAKSKKNLRLHFSLNALNNEMDLFTGVPHSFQRWEESIKEALRSSKHYRNVTITGLVTFGEYNAKSISDIKEYLLHKIGVHDYSIQLARSHDGFESTAPVQDYLYHVHQYFRNESKQNSFLRAYRELVREYSANYYQRPRYITRCYAGTTRAVMSPDGNVYPCEILGYPNGKDPEEWLMGNIRDYNYDLNNVINSPKAIYIRERIKSSRCHCEHGIDLSLNLACNNLFKISILLRGTKYFFQNMFR